MDDLHLGDGAGIGDGGAFGADNVDFGTYALAHTLDT